MAVCDSFVYSKEHYLASSFHDPLSSWKWLTMKVFLGDSLG